MWREWRICRLRDISGMEWEGLGDVERQRDGKMGKMGVVEWVGVGTWKRKE